MELKTSAELFLGVQEQKFMVEALADKGYKRLTKNIATSYGVVKTTADTTFNSLKVIASGSNQLGIKKGMGIDSNINVIDIPNDVLNILTVPSDNISRYVVIKYVPTVIETGLINIQADGSLFGVSTSFTKRLRGIPNFPSKIVFPQSTNNIGEYTILSVQSDTVASLNIAQGQLVPENGQKYAVVGTFTPFTFIDSNDKFPFVGDGYVVELRTTTSVVSGLEFVLAEVKYDGSTLSIFDRRLTNLFSTNPITNRQVSSSNPVIGVEKITYDNIQTNRTDNLMTIGWGIESESGQWGVNSNLQQLSISSVSGGKITSTSGITTSMLDGWKVVFESTGQVIQITSSIVTGGQLLLNVDYLATYPTVGKLVIVPNADLIEISIQNATQPIANKVLSFTIQSRKAIIDIQRGIQSTVSFRHILAGSNTNVFTNIGDGSYYNEDAFNSLGILTTPINTTTYALGQITPKIATTNVLTDLVNRLTILESISAVFTQGGGMVLWQKPVAEIPSGWQEVVDWRGRLAMGYDPANPLFNTIGGVLGSSQVALSPNNNAPHTHGYKDIYHSEVGGTVNTGGLGSGDTDGDNAGYQISRITDSQGGSGIAPTQGDPFSILNPMRIAVFIERV